MNILGLHAKGHDTGACLLAGEQLYSISEERLTREKHDGSFPEASIRYVLRACGLRGLEEVDLVVLDLIDHSPDGGASELRRLGFRGSIVPIRHHDAHAASAFFASPFEDAAVLVADSYGSCGGDVPLGALPHPIYNRHDATTEVQSFYRGNGNRLTLIRRTVTTDTYGMGLGTFYEMTTLYLGFAPLEAGKTMALAAYGDKELLSGSSVFNNFAGDLLAETNGRSYDARQDWAHFGREFFQGLKNREPHEPIRKKDAVIASFAQHQLEEAMLLLARHLRDITGSHNLCLAGGVALNCLVNRRILDESGFEGVFIQPAASDTGIPLGCALYGYHMVSGQPRKFQLKHAFLGRPYSTEEIDSSLAGMEVERPETPEALCKQVAEEIARGKIVGWFYGASELGPRALGHRSILADPRDLRVKDRLSRKVKRRERFRPYAPAILAERARDYFDLKAASPFMLSAAKVLEDKRPLIPAVTHIDGTARVQTVSREENPRFHELIASFEELTGLPILLNTSFNTRGMPIVETPEDALDCFMSTEMDLLVLEDRLLKREKMPSPAVAYGKRLLSVGNEK